MKEGTYICDHDWWNSEGNWYLFEAKWYFENNYPEMPDQEILKSIELIDQDRNAPDISYLLDEKGDIWNYIKSEGIVDTSHYEDYRDYDKDDL